MKQTLMQYVMVVLLVASAFFIGKYKTEAEYLKKGVTTTTTPVGQQAAVAQPVDMAKVDALFADKENMVFGDRDSDLKFIMFSDTSCPFCHVAAGHNPVLAEQMNPRFKAVAQGGTYVPPVLEIKKLVDSGDAAFMWLYTPGHGNGELGTLALYCANEQGKFWQAHDLLMNNDGYALVNEKVLNDRAKSGEIAEFLKSAADPAKLKSCIDSKKYEARVTGDPTIASGFGYGATPTFFINETVVEGAASWNDSFKSVVEGLL